MFTNTDTTVLDQDQNQAIANTEIRNKIVPALCAAILGLTLLFVAGFAETQVMHSAAHDGRHSASFPCH